MHSIASGNHKIKVIIFNNNNKKISSVKICSPVTLEISPSPHGRQSKQQRGRPFIVARLVPGGQRSLHMDHGG